MRNLCFWLFIVVAIKASAQDNTNYVLTETRLNADGTHRIKNYQFFDGLGRQ